jgi:putative oxidoreductase
MTGILSWRGHSYLAFPARVYLAVIFLAACRHKILHPGPFAMDIATYQILPLIFVNPMAIVLPWVELAAGLMLLSGFRTRAAALLVAAMMAVFTAAICIALAKGLDMSCGCFASQGMEEDPISRLTILRDLFWLALSVYVLAFDSSWLGIDRLFSKRNSGIQSSNKHGENP